MLYLQSGLPASPSERLVTRGKAPGLGVKRLKWLGGNVVTS